MSTRILLVAGGATFAFGLVAGWLVFINLSQQTRTRATGTASDSGGGALSNGEIISEFTWEKDPVTLATLGPDAVSCSKDAHTHPGGRSSTGGLSAGPNGKDIDLVLSTPELYNQEGIDISIDYRRNEPDGSFYYRSSGFNFGIENGFLQICYKTENAKGNTETVKERTAYEIPDDAIFRTYRFIYTPLTGKAEIFVNNVMVWSHQGASNTALSWKNAGPVVIGKNMNGSSADRAILDNLVIRTTGSISPLAETLLYFMLEEKDGGVKIHWSSTSGNKTDKFTIERSINGVDFSNLSNIKADPDKKEDEEYTWTDASVGDMKVAYYRLRQTFQNGKFVIHPLSAIRFKAEKDLAIDHVSPSTFEKSFDISYFIPKQGRVWLQLCDMKGNVVSTESFMAPSGKNVHVFRDDKNLQSGPYTLQLIFDNRKVSTVVTKS